MLQATGVMWAHLWLSSDDISDHQKCRKNLIMNLRHSHREPGTGYNFPSDSEIPEGWEGQNSKKFWREEGLDSRFNFQIPFRSIQILSINLAVTCTYKVYEDPSYEKKYLEYLYLYFNILEINFPSSKTLWAGLFESRLTLTQD